MPISNRTLVRTTAALMFAGMPSLFLTAAATAATRDDAAPSVTVRYQDLNLNSQDGVTALYGRIRGAAGEVCRPLESRELGRRVLWNHCLDHAVSDAVYAVHNRTLSAYHWQRTHGWKHGEIESPTTVASR